MDFETEETSNNNLRIWALLYGLWHGLQLANSADRSGNHYSATLFRRLFV